MIPNRHKTLVAFLTAVSLVVLSTATRAETAVVESPTQPRPKIGLVLSGGGARGAAHIGVLRAIEELHVPIDYIAGTSMGAIVGGLYASGMSPYELEQALTEIDWGEIFTDRPDRRQLSVRRKVDDAIFLVNKDIGFKDGKLRLPAGFIQGQKLYVKLQELTLPTAGINDFDELNIPFRAVASDLATGEAVVLDSGELASAMRASMAVPAVFAASEADSKMLVDGGISNNLPIDVVRDMGADILIVVDISTPLRPKEELTSLFSVVDQLTSMLTRRNTEAQLATLTDGDILITPDMGDIGSADFRRGLQAVQRGVEAAYESREDLNRVALPKTQYAGYLNAKDRKSWSQPMIEFVRIENDSDIADEVIQSLLNVQVNQPLDAEALEEDLGTIYGLDVFESVEYSVVEEDGKTGVVINTKQKPWGPNYLQAGLRLSSNLSEENRLNVNLGYLRTPINRFNGEWRSVAQLGDEPALVTELYQPLGLGSPYFFLPRLFAVNDRFNTLDGDEILSENRVRRIGGSVAVGREFGTWGQLQFGLTRFSGDVDVRVGVPSEPTGSFDNGEFFARFGFDTLDNINFPQSGLFGSVEWLLSRDGLGADEEFDQLLFDALAAKTWGRNTVLLGGSYFTTYDGEAPLQNRFRAGGLFNLPGFADNQLTGQHFAVLRLGYMRPIQGLFALRTYIGGTLQQGNVFEDENDISLDNTITAGSVFVGVDTFFGPVYFGYGVAEGGNESIHLLLGRLF